MQQILDFLTSFLYRFINVWLLIGNNFKKKENDEEIRGFKD